MSQANPAMQLAQTVADCLDKPEAASRFTRAGEWHPQSLAYGVPGIALLHIELAAAGVRPWQRVHDWLASQRQFVTGPQSNLYYGAPAFAHAMACAAEVAPGSYQRALSSLDDTIATAVRERVGTAHARLDRKIPPALSEFDTIRGLTGYGAYLLRRQPQGGALREVLDYLVRLTKPVVIDNHEVPGWWSQDSPSRKQQGQFPHGHSNHGLAHGIAGPLALLSLAARAGVRVHNQMSAIRSICDWLDTWEVTRGGVTKWPYWLGLSEIRNCLTQIPWAQRPSWCYGTGGIGRALQLAAIAIQDPVRRQRAESAVAKTFADDAALSVTHDSSLCHGFAGLAHMAAVVAVDAAPQIAHQLRTQVPGLFRRIQQTGPDAVTVAQKLLESPAAGPGFLDGAAGTALAGLAATAYPPLSRWDTCLLIV